MEESTKILSEFMEFVVAEAVLQAVELVFAAWSVGSLAWSVGPLAGSTDCGK